MYLDQREREARKRKVVNLDACLPVSHSFLVLIGFLSAFLMLLFVWFGLVTILFEHAKSPMCFLSRCPLGKMFLTFFFSVFKKTFVVVVVKDSIGKAYIDLDIIANLAHPLPVF